MSQINNGDDDYMEIGDSGWIPIAEGWFFNRKTRHSIDDLGYEYDENGNLISDPNDID
jgi:hypothetical protein